MKTLTFQSTIIVEDDNPDIMNTIFNLSAGIYDIETTDDFIGQPTIFLSKKQEVAAEITTTIPVIKEDGQTII